jgi:ActD protein
MVGYGLEYWTMVIAYPMNVGGRPYHAWVNFIPPAFETTILFSAFAAVFGMFALNGLPRPHHPVFGAKRFALASSEKFFLAIEATDPKFDAKTTREFLAGLSSREVVELED